MTIADFDRDRAMAETLLEKYGQQDDDTPIAWFGMDDDELLKAWKDIDEDSLAKMLERLNDLDEDHAHRLLVLFGRQHGYLPTLPGMPYMPWDELQRRRERALLPDWPRTLEIRAVALWFVIFMGLMLVKMAMTGGF